MSKMEGDTSEAFYQYVIPEGLANQDSPILWSNFLNNERRPSETTTSADVESLSDLRFVKHSFEHGSGDRSFYVVTEERKTFPFALLTSTQTLSTDPDDGSLEISLDDVAGLVEVTHHPASSPPPVDLTPPPSPLSPDGKLLVCPICNMGIGMLSRKACSKKHDTKVMAPCHKPSSHLKPYWQNRKSLRKHLITTHLYANFTRINSSELICTLCQCGYVFKQDCLARFSLLEELLDHIEQAHAKLGSKHVKYQHICAPLDEESYHSEILKELKRLRDEGIID